MTRKKARTILFNKISDRLDDPRNDAIGVQDFKDCSTGVKSQISEALSELEEEGLVRSHCSKYVIVEKSRGKYIEELEVL